MGDKLNLSLSLLEGFYRQSGISRLRSKGKGDWYVFRQYVKFVGRVRGIREYDESVVGGFV